MMKEKALDEMINAIRIEDYAKVNKMIDNGYVFSETGAELQFLTCNDNFDVSLVEKMIKNGAKVDAENELGFTPLFNISYVSRKEVAEILIKNGADINHKTHLGSTCLMNCVSGSDFNFDYFIYLIENGATIKDKDVDEETIVDYAINSNKSEKIINTLKKIYDGNYDFNSIKKICLDDEFKILKSDIDKIKEEFSQYKYSLQNSNFKNFYYGINNDSNNVDSKKIAEINKLLENKEYFKAYRLWQTIMSHIENKSNIYLYFILLDILIESNLKEESTITINAINRMLDVNNIREKYSDKLSEYMNKVSKFNEKIDVDNDANEILNQKSFKNEKYIIPDECYLSAQKKIKDFFESFNPIQRAAIDDSNIKIKRAVKLSLEEYNKTSYMQLVNGNNDEDYEINSSNIELVVEGCKSFIDILENDIKTATTLISLIYPEAVTIIYQNIDIMIDVSKSRLYCFIIEKLTDYILNSHNNKLINFYKEEVIPIVISYFLRDECIEQIYANFILAEIENFKANNLLKQSIEENKDGYTIVNCNDEDFSKIRNISGYLAGDFSLMLNAFEKQDYKNVYIIKKDNILIGDFSLKYEEDIINLYVFFIEDTTENLINHMNYLIKYIKENYDFDKCQIRMTDAGPGGNQMFMLNIFNKIEDLSVHNKNGISVWWYGFNKK